MQHLATSLMDCSDGLAASARLIAEASGVGMTLDLAKLPNVPALNRWAASRKKAAWSYALHGGEDYELIFTVSPKQWPRVRRASPKATVIGRVGSARGGLWAMAPDGQRIPLKGYGFAHFQA
jgi:thiamine-monophosphate kinase